MQATVQDRYGCADVLRLKEIGRPAIQAGEVLVRVRAAGLDQGTWHLMAGQPYLVRLLSGLRAPKNPVPGCDVAGTVVAVARLKPGEEVFGISKGSFAEYSPARRTNSSPSPPTCPSSPGQDVLIPRDSSDSWSFPANPAVQHQADKAAQQDPGAPS
jgi:NADPH:quinone reductase-like Zn-dependent oxidoreductase